MARVLVDTPGLEYFEWSARSSSTGDETRTRSRSTVGDRVTRKFSDKRLVKLACILSRRGEQIARFREPHEFSQADPRGVAFGAFRIAAPLGFRYRGET